MYAANSVPRSFVEIFGIIMIKWRFWTYRRENTAINLVISYKPQILYKRSLTLIKMIFIWYDRIRVVYWFRIRIVYNFFHFVQQIKTHKYKISQICKMYVNAKILNFFRTKSSWLIFCYEKKKYKKFPWYLQTNLKNLIHVFSNIYRRLRWCELVHVLTIALTFWNIYLAIAVLKTDISIQ